jgi:aryl-alcohol dehydrogenase
MPDTLAALARSAHAPLEFETVTLDDPRPDEVLVEVMAAGICHTDLSARDQYLPVPLPAVLGHEGAGIVRAVGSAVTTTKVGDRVILSQAFCGTCVYCRTGDVTACEQSMALGLGGRRSDGSSSIHDAAGAPLSSGFLGQSSFARYALAREANVVTLTEELPWEIAAPLGCGVQTGAGTVLNVLKPSPSDSIVVFGAGTVGLSAVLAARHAGCSTVIVVDVIPSRLALGLELGASHAVDASATDHVEQIIELTSGGAAFAIEASGAPAAGPAAVASLARRGTCALVGAPPFGTKIEADWIGIVSGRTLLGAVFGGGHPAATVGKLLEMRRGGNLPLEKLVSTYPLAAINEAIKDMEAGSTVKPVLLAASAIS